MDYELLLNKYPYLKELTLVELETLRIRINCVLNPGATETIISKKFCEDSIKHWEEEKITNPTHLCIDSIIQAYKARLI